ncbi:hypothetical protein AHMF7605_03355 [Adhaeribacter arboris]|uniref:Outer membrane protein beta-barrel domain-containing protein n=1 Tax=Adhaeribacter arboris TaxID=2072846 RepID=A0A2T2YB14_9BACT|nr:hypothetical protein [Adhaeribacter arboris]PSR52628.1 hypothetical protein AHMF7605_03355 [Adhaeribacter arboris]
MKNNHFFRTQFLILLFCLLLSSFRSNAQLLANAEYNAVFDSSANPIVSKSKLNTPLLPELLKTKRIMNTPGRGALFGFAIGGTGGIVLGLSGKEWVLANGKVVPRPLHAVVDLFIVATPLTIMGLVVGARRDVSTLAPSRFHVALGGGWASVMTYQSIKNAYAISGIPNHIPHWFGYLHYPNGENSSTPYTWNITTDYNLERKFQLGISFNNFVNQEIRGGTDHHEPGPEYEAAKGETYSLLANYILNPITPQNKTRLEFAAGAGPSFHNLLVRGSLGTNKYEVRKKTITTHYRATIDYYSRQNLSLQLKAGYRPRQTVRVPEQEEGSTNLIAHAVNFRSLDITIGVRYHLKPF